MTFRATVSIGACGVLRCLALDAQLVQVRHQGHILSHPVLVISGLQLSYSVLHTKMSTNRSFMLSHDIGLEGAWHYNLWLKLSIVQAVKSLH